MTDSDKLNLILEKVEGLGSQFHVLDKKVDSMDDRLNTLDKKVGSMDDRLNHVATDLQDVKQQVTRTNLIMENELRVNIQRVAEGHLDLSRNLHEAMRPGNEVEMLAIKVRVLESDVRDLKDKVRDKVYT